MPLRRSFSLLDAEVRIRVSSDESEGRYALIEMDLPPHFPGAPPHLHRFLTERFLVLEGTLAVRLGDEWRSLAAGESAVALPGAVHSFRNATAERTRMILFATPGGHERFFAELMEWIEREAQWPPADLAALREFGLRHDTEYLG